MYDQANGVKQDHHKAYQWYHKAAVQGFANAQFNLGIMYAFGNGTKKDLSKAYAWLSISLSKNSTPEEIEFKEKIY